MPMVLALNASCFDTLAEFQPLVVGGLLEFNNSFCARDAWNMNSPVNA
jgi:hypothetical protein